MASRAKKTHPEDEMLADQVRKADRWSACIHLGPGDRQTRYVDTYEQAVEAKAELDATSRFGRQAMIYAINKLGSFPVDIRLARLAGLVA